MPVYDYRCEGQCDDFEKQQSIHDKPLIICEVCGSKVHRLISRGVGIQFSGSGFYINDSKGSSSNSSSGSSKKS